MGYVVGSAARRTHCERRLSVNDDGEKSWNVGLFVQAACVLCAFVYFSAAEYKAHLHYKGF